MSACSVDWGLWGTWVGVIVVAIVGAIQCLIFHRQADIARRTVDVALFERRYGVFERTKALFAHILREADVPDFNGELVRQFIVAKGEAEFLFSDFSTSSMNEIWVKYCEFGELKSTMKHIYQREQHYGDGNPAREATALTWFFEQFQNLSNMFPELKLGGDF